MSFFNSITKIVKQAAVAFALIVLVAANAAPAFAFGSTPSKPSDGEASLTEVRKESEKVANSKPRSGDEVSSVAKGGLNGVQGAASKDKMVKDAPDATTVKDDVVSGIKSITGQD